jgi:hypothetical protein
MIKNLQDLAHHVSAARDASTGATDEETASSIGRRLYKDTDCGICFSAKATGVSMAGYAEGSNAECSDIDLDFPFTGEAFDAAVKEADEEGSALWDECNQDQTDFDEIPPEA